MATAGFPTKITELLGIQYPILQGGMAWISDPSLVAAVSNGGGLGILSAMNGDGEAIRQAIHQVRELTDKPFGVNVMLLSRHVQEIATVLAEEKVPVITTGAGSPMPYMEQWKKAGAKVIPVVASVALAKLVRRAGADAIIAEGGEAGGHIGELTTMVLVPQVCDAVDVPVIAAGGIADGRGLAAVMMLGATGVQMGTRFLLAEECNIHPTFKERVLKAKDIDTVATGRRLGHPIRCLKTPFTRKLVKMEYDSTVTDEQLEEITKGSLMRAVQDGDVEGGSFMAGQVAAMVRAHQPAAQMIAEICTEAHQILKGVEQWVN